MSIISSTKLTKWVLFLQGKESERSGSLSNFSRYSQVVPSIQLYSNKYRKTMPRKSWHFFIQPKKKTVDRPLEVLEVLHLADGTKKLPPRSVGEKFLTIKLPGPSVEKTNLLLEKITSSCHFCSKTQGTLSHASWRCRGCNNFIIRIQDLQSQQNETGENTMHFHLKLRISSRFVRIFYFCCLLAFDFGKR